MWSLQAMVTRDLEVIPARDLDKFIEHHLLPDTPFRTQVKQAIDTICSFLKVRCFLQDRVRVSKVVKGGSSGKGTALKDRSDADLVVFLSPLTSFQEQFERRGEFIQEIRTQLEACQQEIMFTVHFEVQKSVFWNPRALSFTLKSRSSWAEAEVEFDVLPAYDVLGQVTGPYRPDPDVYVRLIRECERLGKEGEFSPCFTELQRAFLKQRPAKLKSLIRLVKHWYQKCKEKLGQSLPPQYALELLTVYAWERAGRQTDFSTAQGFRTVLELVMNYRQLCIHWTQYYDSSHPVIGPYLRRQLQKPRRWVSSGLLEHIGLRRRRRCLRNLCSQDTSAPLWCTAPWVLSPRIHHSECPSPSRVEENRAHTHLSDANQPIRAQTPTHPGQAPEDWAQPHTPEPAGILRTGPS